jgi:hypothetical protein
MVAAVVATIASPWGPPAKAAALVDKKLPNSMQATVEGQALIYGAGALSLLADPGPAYVFAQMNYTRFGDDDPPEVAMKAVGAVLSPGTIPAAVIWAPPPTTNWPSCGGNPAAGVAPNSQCLLIPTGVHEAAGFPGYSEAFYPTFEGFPNREHTYKCAWSKDAIGANPTKGALGSTCKNDLEATPAYGAADTWRDTLHSRGFARFEGASAGALTAGLAEGLADVAPDENGKVTSFGNTAMTNIDILDGVVHLDSVHATAKVVAVADDASPKISVACTFSGLTIAGQTINVEPTGVLDSKQVNSAVAQAKSLGFAITVIPPPPAKITTSASSRKTAECTGLKVLVEPTGSSLPPDVDPQGHVAARQEFLFGFMKISVSVNKFEGFDLGGLAGGDLASAGDLGAPGDSAPSVLGSTVSALGDAFTPSSPNLSPTPSAGARRSTNAAGGAAAAGGASTPKKVNTALIASLTTATSATIGFSIWLLLAVVLALSRGTTLRLPGTRL